MICPRPRFPAESQALADVSVPDSAEAFWETTYQQRLAARALEILRSQFQPANWQACGQVVVEEQPGAMAAAALGFGPGAGSWLRERLSYGEWERRFRGRP